MPRGSQNNTAGKPHSRGQPLFLCCKMLGIEQTQVSFPELTQPLLFALLMQKTSPWCSLSPTGARISTCIHPVEITYIPSVSCYRVPYQCDCDAFIQQWPGSDSLLLILTSEPLPPARAIPSAHGSHQQLGPLLLLWNGDTVCYALLGHERQHGPAELPALSVLLPVTLPCSAGLVLTHPAGLQLPPKPEQ